MGLGGADGDGSGVDAQYGAMFPGLSGDGVLGGLLGDFVGYFFEDEHDEVGEFVSG